MNKFAIAALVVSLAQIAFGGGGLYCLFRAMRGIKAIGRAETTDQAWNTWFKQAMWTLGMGGLLLVCSLLSLSLSQGWLIVVLVCGVLLGLSILQTVLVVRRINTVPHAEEPAQLKQVVVKSLKPNRVRGLADDGSPLYFTEADLVGFKEVRGYARMLPFRPASIYQGNASAMVPLLSFENARGASFVLYQDDIVEVEKKAA